MNRGSYSLGELIFDIGCLLKKYEEKNMNEKKKSELLKTKQVLEKYPILTQYGLDQAVKNSEIPVIKRGKLNFFESSDIEKFIQNQKKSIKNDCISEKIKYI